MVRCFLTNNDTLAVIIWLFHLSKYSITIPPYPPPFLTGQRNTKTCWIRNVPLVPQNYVGSSSGEQRLTTMHAHSESAVLTCHYMFQALSLPLSLQSLESFLGWTETLVCAPSAWTKRSGSCFCLAVTWPRVRTAPLSCPTVQSAGRGPTPTSELSYRSLSLRLCHIIMSLLIKKRVSVIS